MDPLLQLFVLAIPVACVSWTVTHEEIFKEAREWCQAQAGKEGRPLWWRKFCYLPTCEYCFSHYVAVLAVWGTSSHLLVEGIAGMALAVFATVWVANLYMNLHFRLRLAIRESGNRSKGMEQAQAGAEYWFKPMRKS